MKLTIDEYAKKFKMSKEMVLSKVKSNLVEFLIEDEITFIVIEDEIPKEIPQQKSKSKALVSSKKQKNNCCNYNISLSKRE